jgi:hypothetical protein
VLEIKRVNITLRKDTHSQAKIISVLKSIPLNKYLELCINKGVKGDQKILGMIRVDNSQEKDTNNKQIK